MANPQLENGYTSIANEILDNLCKLSLNGTELKVVICIFRYTFGFRRKSHKLSASFIARWGKCDVRAVKRALKKLQEDKIIICVNSEMRGVTSELMFNKNYEQWIPTSGQNVTSGQIVTSGQNVTGAVVKSSPDQCHFDHTRKEKLKEKSKEKYYDDFFEKLWKEYPKKKGKSAVSKKAKKVLYEEGESVVLEAIKAYKAEIQENGTEEKYILHGSTFFNGRWRDYIKEHKSKPVPEKPSEEPEQPIDYSNVERKW